MTVTAVDKGARFLFSTSEAMSAAKAVLENMRHEGKQGAASYYNEGTFVTAPDSTLATARTKVQPRHKPHSPRMPETDLPDRARLFTSQIEPADPQFTEPLSDPRSTIGITEHNTRQSGATTRAGAGAVRARERGNHGCNM